MPHKEKKYRIDELLLRLPVEKNKMAIKCLPGVLNVAESTFNNYRAIRLTDRQDIPHEKVTILEQFFGIKPGELKNYTVSVRPVSEMRESDNCFDPAKFGLTL